MIIIIIIIIITMIIIIIIITIIIIIKQTLISFKIRKNGTENKLSNLKNALTERF